MLPDPALPPDDAEDDPAAFGSVLCPHCAASNLPAADFCARCGAPLSVIASTDPLRSTLSEGFLYREATGGTPKRIVLVGIWLLFLPGLSSLPFAWAGGETDPHRLALPGLWSLLSAVIPVLTTVNYVRKRRAANPLDEEPPESLAG